MTLSPLENGLSNSINNPETRFAAVSCNASPITKVSMVADATIAVISTFN